MMQIRVMAAVAAMVLGLTITPSLATSTVTGELVTVMCVVGNGEKGRGADHAACALKCANEGYPLAIITKDGDMYKVVGKLTADNNKALHGLLTKTVVATGEISSEGEGKTLDASSIVAASPEMRH